uniref:NADH dehydrogenase [ubiquinone] 1 alpha subcomplex subunit 2 n=1 Tax=Astatotilapia calliptera TaxID=8154 RepID=A0AAX7SMT9_ASTCA
TTTLLKETHGGRGLTHIWTEALAPADVQLEFVEQNYVTLKRSNPEFPILIRECSGVQARLWARYDFGKETSVSVENMSADQVAKALQTLAQSKP